MSVVSSSVAWDRQVISKQAANGLPLQADTKNDLPTPAGWKRFEFNKPLTFSLILPGEPEQQVYTLPGKTETSYIFISSSNSDVYGAKYIDDLPSLARHWEAAGNKLFSEIFLKDFVVKIEAQSKEKVLDFESKINFTADRRVIVSGLDGLERDFSIDGFHGRLQLVRVGQAGFCVIAIWKQSTPPAEREAFFSSVKITGEEH